MPEKSMQDLEHEIVSGIRSRVESPLMVDLGCGYVELPDGFKGADLYARGENILPVNLFERPWPFENESVDLFTSSHFVEHVTDWNLHFEEVYRCLKPNGCYRVIGPYAKSDRAMQDPTHKQWLLEARFHYLNQNWLRPNKIEHDNHARVNFAIAALGYWWHDDYADKSPEAQAYALAHVWNAANDIQVILRKEAMIDAA